MEQPLTPPPSFRALRVRTRTRTRTISDENKCENIAPVGRIEGFGAPVRPRKDSSPVRGRTRSRVVRNGLTLNTNCIRPHFSLGLPACCSPAPSHGDADSVGGDDDLIFTMSPVQTQSPTLACFNGVHEVRAERTRAKQSTMQTLSALWEKHKSNLAATTSQPHSPRTPVKRQRTDAVAQHQRGRSDTQSSVSHRRGQSSELRPRQNIKAPFDLPQILHAPVEPPSPPPEEPFMYSFPSFDSSPLVKARQARARRQASKASAQREFLTGGLESESIAVGAEVSMDEKVENDPPQRLGPIRARKLRIQSGESLSDDVDDTNFISHAFKSASLDPEKESDLDDGESFDTGYFSSQRSSSLSSSSTTDGVSLDRGIGYSSSLLASFPVRPSSRSRTHSKSSSRGHSRRTSSSKIDAEANATAMMTRGRASRRASAEIHQAPVEYVGAERRSRGRTPPRGRRSDGDSHAVTVTARTNVR